MSKTFRKTIRRSILARPSRFIALTALVALGVGFLTGLLSITPSMRGQMNEYLADQQVADLMIYHPLGLSEEAIEVIDTTSSIKNVLNYEMLDQIVYAEDERLTARRYTFEAMPNINQLTLIEGDFPQNPSECVIEQSDFYLVALPIGRTITYQDESCRVVGTVQSPWYFSKESETTEVGTNRLGVIIYQFKPLTQIQGTMVQFDLTNPNYFSDEYLNIIESYKSNLSDTLPEPLMMNYIFLTHQENVSLRSFDMNIQKVDDIARVFPLFFFLVAALVALTTMTRMVEEERIILGTYKALGFSRYKILNKYLVYGMSASLLGIIVGVLSGFYLLPILVYDAYESIFFLPEYSVRFEWVIILIASLLAIASIIIATLAAVLNRLKERPADLLVQRSPKPGKRILLERVPFFWKRLKFKYKSSLRNVFRYKRNLFMIVLGIAGSMGLILTGFGMLDSITKITDTQYNTLINYDMVMSVESLEDERVCTFLESDECERFVHTVSVLSTVSYGDEHIELTLHASDQYESFTEMVTLRNMRNQKVIPFEANSVIVTEQVALNLHLEINDIITVENRYGSFDVRISGITENYVENYLYIDRVLYEHLMEQPFETNTVLVKTTLDDPTVLRESLLENSNVTSVTFTSDTLEVYERLLDVVYLVVIVVIISAGALAIIVIYQIMNINIYERIREIATLKVLGYYKSEVSGYIIREVIVQSAFGIALGVWLGQILHGFIILTIDSDGLILGRDIYLSSNFYAIGLTLVFIFGVILIMNQKLKKIHMVESLKAND